MNVPGVEQRGKGVQELFELFGFVVTKALVGPEALVGVAQELDTDDLGGEAGKGEALRGAQEQLELQPVRVEQRATEDRGVKRHDLYCDARLRLRICSTVSAPDTSPWASWRRASVC